MKLALLDHHLNNYHADKFLGLLRGPLASEGIVVVAAWESNPVGDDWCKKNSVSRAATAEEAVRLGEVLMVLAPDNVEDHLKLCSVALPSGKPTFVDKFLAPTLHDALEIADMAERHRTPLFSSSALRYAVELEQAWDRLKSQRIGECYARGLAGWDGYGVHTLAMAQRMMGPGARRLIDTGTPTARTVTIDYGDGRRASLDVRSAKNEWELFGWSFGARVGDAYVASQVKDFDGFYANLMKRCAAFFRSGKAEMEVSDALATVAILETANRSLKRGGEWEELPKLG